MRETYRDNDTPPQKRTHALKPKLRSWNGRVWLATSTSFQLMLKLDASLAISEIEDSDLRALSPFAAELASFALYLDYTDENHLPLPWAVGAFHMDRAKHAFMLLQFPGHRAC